MERRRRTKSRSRAPRDRYLSDLSAAPGVGSEILKTVPRTAVIRRRDNSTEETLAIVEIENRQDLELLQDKSFIKSLLEDGGKEDGASLSSSSDEEQEERRNPLFPTL